MVTKMKMPNLRDIFPASSRTPAHPDLKKKMMAAKSMGMDAPSVETAPERTEEPVCVLPTVVCKGEGRTGTYSASRTLPSRVCEWPDFCACPRLRAAPAPHC
jgi:hypothetical protein